MSKTKNSLLRSNSLGVTMIFLVAFLIYGCEGEVDTRGVAKELKDRKIRKITDSQILSEAENSATSMLREIDSIWNERLSSRKGGQVSACELDSIYELYKDQFNVEILRIGINPLDQKAIGDSMQRQLLDSYLYNAEQNLPMKSNTQRLGKQHIIFTAPIVVKSEDCLSCHGGSKNISEKNSLALSKNYPSYKSQNFKKDSLIGMWSLTFTKKYLVSKIK